MTRTLTLKETSAGYAILPELTEPVTEPTFVKHNGLTLGVLIPLDDYRELAPRWERAAASEWEAEQTRLIKQEIAAYERMKPKLLKTHKGQFVAILDGELVDSDEDEITLLDRIEERYGDITVLIKDVVEFEPVYEMGGPQLVRT